MTPSRSPVPGNKVREYCSGDVWHGRTGFHQCSRRPVVAVDGKPYCKQHAPDSVAARKLRAKQMESLDQRVREAARDADIATDRALDALLDWPEPLSGALHDARQRLRFALTEYEAARKAVDDAGGKISAFTRECIRGVYRHRRRPS